MERSDLIVELNIILILQVEWTAGRVVYGEQIVHDYIINCVETSKTELVKITFTEVKSKGKRQYLRISTWMDFTVKWSSIGPSPTLAA